MMLLLLFVLPLFFNAADDKKKILIIETDCGVDQKWNERKYTLEKTYDLKYAPKTVSFLTKEQLQDIKEVHIYGPLDGADAFWAGVKRKHSAVLVSAQDPKAEVDRTAKAWYHPFLYYAIPFIWHGNKVFESPLDYILNIDLENKVRKNLLSVVFYTGSELEYTSAHLMPEIFLHNKGENVVSVKLNNFENDSLLVSVTNHEAVGEYLKIKKKFKSLYLRVVFYLGAITFWGSFVMILYKIAKFPFLLFR